MATYTISNPGNTALQTEVWTLTQAEAKATIPLLHCASGSYWADVILKPYRRAIRAKAATVQVYTAGFSTGELANAMASVAITITQR